MTTIDTSRLDLILTPQGKLHIEIDRAIDGQTEAVISLKVGSDLIAAFEQGTSAGLLYLAGSALSEELPPLFAFWRNFSRTLVSHLCAMPDLEEKRRRLELAAPAQEFSDMIADVPPMQGGEYVSTDYLGLLWNDLVVYIQSCLATFNGTVEEFLHSLNPAWHVVGRVCFHLAENKQNENQPFAFMATYANRLSAKANVQHLPLGRAVHEFSGASNKNALIALLKPVQLAAEKSQLLKSLVDSGEVFHPLAWTAHEAYRFLKDIPAFEAAGVIVRVPNWWRAKKPPRPEVRVTVGKSGPPGLGLDALLDFNVDLTLDGKTVTAAEWQEILKSTSGLVSIKGQWVEIDQERLSQVLDHWRKVQKSVAEDGISFADAMRLLAGASSLAGGIDSGATGPDDKDWQQFVAGDWLSKTLTELHHPDASNEADPGPALNASLRPYQKSGVEWLWRLHRLRLGACLADDMGLGKTIQILSLLLILKKRSKQAHVLLVVPTSLIGNWLAEAERFAPSLRLLVLHPSALSKNDDESRIRQKIASTDLSITTYGLLSRYKWMSDFDWDLIVLDEAQAIKNPGAKQTVAAKSIKAKHRIALTGTPVENRLSDLWSIFDFICPGLLGNAKGFSKFIKSANNPYPALRKLVRPYILRRLKTDRSIISDLPEKVELQAYCSLSKTQAGLYGKAVAELTQKLNEVEGIQRRGLILSFLTRLKQICNHPSHWLGDGIFDPLLSGKFSRLNEICEEINSRQEKVLVFTQFREMTGPLATYLEGVFGKPGLILHGDTPVKQRKVLVDMFQSDDGPPFFILSLKAGGTGLNLTAASHVIHFDRWWNPAVENQATDRAFRIGQKRNVLVHKFICRGTIEEKVAAMIEEKKSMAAEVLEGSAELVLTELGNDDLIKLVSLDLNRAFNE